jgi:hypothetical protein
MEGPSSVNFPEKSSVFRLWIIIIIIIMTGETEVFSGKFTGPEEKRTGGQEDRRTGGQEDMRTGGQEDRRTGGHDDMR